MKNLCYLTIAHIVIDDFLVSIVHDMESMHIWQGLMIITKTSHIEELLFVSCCKDDTFSCYECSIIQFSHSHPGPWDAYFSIYSKTPHLEEWQLSYLGCHQEYFDLLLVSASN